MTPKMGPMVVPKPPIIIMPINNIESAIVKLSVFIKPTQWANNEPDIPAKKQPIKKARSL